MKKTRRQKYGDKPPRVTLNSNYARKRKYLNRTGQWGWEVPAPKPWKKRSK